MRAVHHVAEKVCLNHGAFIKPGALVIQELFSVVASEIQADQLPEKLQCLPETTLYGHQKMETG